MASVDGLEQVAAAGRTTARHAATSPWVHGLGRAGLAARGVVYCVIAGLAVRIALGHQGQTADQKGALQQVADEPLGRFALVLLAAGFAGYAAWRLVCAAVGEPGGPGGTDHGDARKAGRRLSALAQGIIYGGLCVTTISVIAGSGGQSGSQHPSGWTARLLGLPAGRVLVFAVGLGIVAGGAGTIWWALSERFKRKLMTAGLGSTAHHGITALGVAGHASRGGVLCLVGLFLAKAAVEYDPGQAKGLDDTLHTIAGEPFGSALLLVTALGLLAFGLFSFVEARYRRM